MEKYWRTLEERLVNAIRISMFVNSHIQILGFYSPAETGRWILPLLMISFQRHGSQILEKHIAGF